MRSVVVQMRPVEGRYAPPDQWVGEFEWRCNCHNLDGKPARCSLRKVVRRLFVNLGSTMTATTTDRCEQCGRAVMVMFEAVADGSVEVVDGG